MSNMERRSSLVVGNYIELIWAIYTKRTKVFQHLILSHTNNAKMCLFMKTVTSKRYGI